MPSVHQSHHDAELCIGGQVAKIRTVVTVLGHIAVASAEDNARFHAIDLMRAVSLIQQVFPLGDCPH